MYKIIKGLMLFLMLVIIQSCVKNIDPNGNQPPATNVQDLKVPPTFNWVTSKTITCTVNSNASTSLAIYTDKNCTEELLATFTTMTGGSKLPMSVSQSTDKLYLKYTTKSNSDKILVGSISNGSVTFNITDGIQNDVARNVATKSIPTHDGGAYISYPAGWGTVMFEDLFPYLGDYDFNDFVASYQITVEFPWKSTGYDTEHANLIRVHLKLKAIGGSLNFNPYIRIVGLNKDKVSLPTTPYNDPNYVNPLIFNNTTDGVKVAKINSNLTSDVIIEFQDLNATNPNKVNGFSFYNTTPGGIMKANQLTEVTIYLKLSEEVDVASLLDDKIDIFLASEDKDKEIHVRGFNPVFSPYDFNVEGVHKTITYATSENIVWGIKVAQGIQHAVEKTNFSKAYPDFASWAQSGGTTHTKWHITNAVKANLIKWVQ